jgi:tetratricopeptide (TPR) repeat protein
MAIEGPLEELGIQDVLQLLELAHKTGVLTIRSDRLNDEAIVHFRSGAVVFAVRRRSPRRLGQLLIRAGRITQRELDRALDLQRTDPTRRLAEVLLEMGSISAEELERQLHFQMEETIFELMGWDEGYFRFEERAEIGQGRLLAQDRVESLLMEGARRIDEWTRLESKVPGPDAVPVLAPTTEREAAPLDLRTEEWEVLAAIDAQRDVRQIAADLGRSAFDVAKTIYGLVSTGVLQVKEQRGRVPEGEFREAVARAERHLDEGGVEAAQKLVAELETAYPERAEVALLAGRALEAQRRMRAATEAYARAVGLDPLSAEGHYRLGFSAVRTGDLDRGARAWDTYLRLATDGAEREIVDEGLAALRVLTRVVESGAR